MTFEGEPTTFDAADYLKFNRMGYIGLNAYHLIKKLSDGCQEREKVEHLLALAFIEGVKHGINSEFS